MLCCSVVIPQGLVNRKGGEFSFAIVVIPECRSRESVFAVLVLFRNGRSPTETFGDDNFLKKRSS